MIKDDLEEGVDIDESMKVIEDPRMNFIEEDAMVIGEKKEEEGKRHYHTNIVLVSFYCSDETKCSDPASRVNLQTDDGVEPKRAS